MLQRSFYNRKQEQHLLDGFRNAAIDFEQREIDTVIHQIFRNIQTTSVRGYALVPYHLDIRRVKKGLQKLISKNRHLVDVVTLFETEHIIHWCIHMQNPSQNALFASSPLSIALIY